VESQATSQNRRTDRDISVCSAGVGRTPRAGLTFEVGDGGRRQFLKWAPISSGIDLAIEADRLLWAARFTPVPQVIEQGRDPSGSWLITEALPGERAGSELWKRKADIAVKAMGEGLRAFHNSLPVDECPYSWSADDRLDNLRKRASLGLLNPTKWHAEHQGLSVADALDQVGTVPKPDRLVVCHGDACAPNTLISEDGTWSGHVDLGRMGVADRWADLAVATWSTEWNYGLSWEGLLLASYGIGADEGRTRYYRLLWDL
jgi:kanamycin kinase